MLALRLLQALLLMLEKHGHRRAVFSGHSLGSVYLSWMCRLAPHAVAASVFIEPIVFMLYLKTVTSSFLYHDYGGIVGTHNHHTGWRPRRCVPIHASYYGGGRQTFARAPEQDIRVTLVVGLEMAYVFAYALRSSCLACRLRHPIRALPQPRTAQVGGPSCLTIHSHT